MFVRNKKYDNQMVGNREYAYRESKTNLYSTAFPFDRCNGGGSGSVAHVALHGRNSAVTTAADIWEQGGLRTFPTAVFTIGVSSSSANDVMTSGTGAWQVEVDVLDENYIPYTLTLNLNGQTKVTDTVLGAHAFRINDVRVKSWGTGSSNVGDIYVYDASDTVTAGVPQTATKIFSKIIATDNVSRGGFYTVPAGCQFQTQQVRTGFSDIAVATRAGVVNLWFYKYRAGGIPTPSNFPISGQMGNAMGFSVVNPDFPVMFEEKWDISFHAAASVSSVMTVYMDGILFYK